MGTNKPNQPSWCRDYSRFRREGSPFSAWKRIRRTMVGIYHRRAKGAASGVSWQRNRQTNRERQTEGTAEGKGTEGTQRLAWRTTIREPNGHRDASFNVRAGHFFFCSSRFLPLPATSGSAETTTVPSTWAMVVSEEFVNYHWNNLKKCRNVETFDQTFIKHTYIVLSLFILLVWLKCKGKSRVSTRTVFFCD